MKYMIMTFGGTSGLEGRSPEWIKEMIEFMQRIDVELTESGELVFQQGLADPSQARTVKVQQGVPVATDGPFAESRESLVGFWVVDVENQARGRARRADQPGCRRPDRGPPVHGRTPRRRHGAGQHLTADAGVEDLLRELAPWVLGVLVRRYEDVAG
jgi:hypothetical protein